MQHFLIPHPDTPPGAEIAVSAVASRDGGRLTLRYLIEGDIDRLRYPSIESPMRTDGLWRATCLEAFVGSDNDPAYLELNFSPSTRWASYRFDDYRAGMREAEIVPAIDVETDDRRFGLHATLDLPDAGRWHLGLTAVIEEQDGRKSYWALAHAPGKPDFHQRTCFVLQLPAAV